MVLLTPETVVQMLRTKPIQSGGQIKKAAFYMHLFASCDAVKSSLRQRELGFYVLYPNLKIPAKPITITLVSTLVTLH